MTAIFLRATGRLRSEQAVLFHRVFLLLSGTRRRAGYSQSMSLKPRLM